MDGVVVRLLQRRKVATLTDFREEDGKITQEKLTAALSPSFFVGVELETYVVVITGGVKDEEYWLVGDTHQAWVAVSALTGEVRSILRIPMEEWEWALSTLPVTQIHDLTKPKMRPNCED